MTVEERLKQTLLDKLLPVLLAVENESASHNVPVGAETHFKVVVVSPAFRGRALVDRHRLVYDAVGDEMRKGLHALSIVSRTPEEWDANPVVLASPPCLGGSKHDR